MKWAVITILAVILIAGCTQRSVDYLYVCPDGSTVNNPNQCDKIVIDMPAPNHNETSLQQIERSIFDIVNDKRNAAGIKSLLWNDDIAKLAREKSVDMAERDYFNHENPKGESFKDILNKKNIFYLVAAEDIFMTSAILTEKALLDSGDKAVDAWLESPAHRVPIMDRDEIYTDTGVGVSCREDICYFTMEFVKIETATGLTLRSNYGSFIYIYDPNLKFDYNVSVQIEVNSTRLIDTYIVEGENNYDLFIQGYPIYSKREYKHADYVNTIITAQSGNGIIFYADPDWVHTDAEISVKIRYII